MNNWRIIICLFLAGLLMAGYQQESDTSGFVGDVRYSVLKPDTFRKYHPGWVLLDGDNISSSKLAKEHGITTLPDARGVFIRSMSEGRTFAQGGDSEPRTIGSPQNDAIKTHTHNLNLNGSYRVAGMHPSDKAEGGNDRGLPTAVNLNIQVLNTGDNLDGPETRPRNITLYAYIKVN